MLWEKKWRQDREHLSGSIEFIFNAYAYMCKTMRCQYDWRGVRKKNTREIIDVVRDGMRPDHVVTLQTI